MYNDSVKRLIGLS